MKSRILAGLLALLGLLALPVVAAPAAHAGWACDTFGACGRVVNASNSARNLAVAGSWPVGKGTPTQSLRPGQKATFKDTDGVYIPPGCWAQPSQDWYMGPGWHKVGDGYGTWTIRIRC